MQYSANRGLTGVQAFLLIGAVLLAMVGAMILADNGGVDGIRLAIRATARTSLLLFLCAFCASAAARLWPGGVSRWLLRNRRWLGLSFAFSHLVHAGAIVLLFRNFPVVFDSLTTRQSIISGGIAYVFIALLAATSFNGAVAALGPKNWKRLHTVGIWFIWISFIFTNGKRVPDNSIYLLPIALLLGALAFRLWVRWGRTSVPQAPELSV